MRLLCRERLSVAEIGKTVLILAACTGVGFLFSAMGLAITNVVLSYILGVLAVALFTSGYIYSLMSSLLSVLVFNFSTEDRQITQYYICGDQEHILIYETNISSSSECDEAAQTIMNTFEWSNRD